MPRNSTCYKIAGTKFFRLGSSKILGLFGGNCQNIEKSMRSIYVVDGYQVELEQKMVAFAESKFTDFSLFTEEELLTLRIEIQCDQSGAEALVVAYLTKPGKFRDLFLNSIKPHVFIGLAFPQHWQDKYPQIDDIRKLDISLIKSHEGWEELRKAITDSDNNPPATRYYYHYKQTCHSSNYDIKAPTFQLNMLEKSGGKVVLTRRQAEEYLAGYHSLFPEIRMWHMDVQQQVRKNRILYNALGYPIYFSGNLLTDDTKDWYSSVPQSTVGCITHIAYTKLQQHIEDHHKQWDLLNNSHDSYLVQCPLMEWKECATLMKQLMEQDLVSPRGEKYKMKSEVQVGFNWGVCKPPQHTIDLYDNLNINKYNLTGLREVKL